MQLGILMLTVRTDEAGKILVDHDASLEPPVAGRVEQMTGAERQKAAELRRRACAAAADYFTFVHDPARRTRAR